MYCAGSVINHTAAPYVWCIDFRRAWLVCATTEREHVSVYILATQVVDDCRKSHLSADAEAHNPTRYGRHDAVIDHAACTFRPHYPNPTLLKPSSWQFTCTELNAKVATSDPETLHDPVSMRALFVLLALCSLSHSFAVRQAAPQHGLCRFSPNFTQDEIMRDPTRFEDNIFYWDGQFHTDGIGYHSSTGLVISHTALGYQTGLPSTLSPEYTRGNPRHEVPSQLLYLALLTRTRPGT